jgi:hypothetical protein
VKKVKLILFSLLFIILSSGFIILKTIEKKTNSGDIVATINILDLDGVLYLETTYRSDIFSDICETFGVVTATYVENCIPQKMDTTKTNPKIKKL